MKGDIPGIGPTDSCAFLPCDQVERCCLTKDGSCHRKKFPVQAKHQDVLKEGRAGAGRRKAGAHNEAPLTS